MFVDLPAPVLHQDPWVLSGESRLARFMRGGPRIAYFYENVDNSTFRYRVHNMIEVIDALWPDASASYFTLADGPILDKVADAADIVVLCRTRYGDRMSRFVQRARRRQIPVVFDIDDFVFDTRYVHLIMHSLGQPTTSDDGWDFWFAYIGRMGAALRLCDRAITTNAFLGQHIADFTGIETSIIPNSMNAWQLDYSREIWDAKRRSGFRRDGHLHIGYFSGSPTHAKDFAIVEGALARILGRYPFVRVRMVGYLEPAGPLLNYQDRIDREPFQDYVNLQRLIGSTEINLAPLQDNTFTNCKSELKYFEAAITGISTVASPTFTFKEAIRPGDNGRLAAAHQWEERIVEVVEEIEQRPEDYAAMSERARADAEARYGWTNQIDVIRAALL